MYNPLHSSFLGSTVVTSTRPQSTRTCLSLHIHRIHSAITAQMFDLQKDLLQLFELSTHTVHTESYRASWPFG